MIICRHLRSAALSMFLVSACGPVPSTPPDADSGSHGMRFHDPPAGSNAMAPELSVGSDTVMLTWLEPMGDGHALSLAELRDDGWTSPRQIASGGDFFANWADRPAIVEAADGARFAHWLAKLGTDTYAYGVQTTWLRDSGEAWKPLGLLHDDDSATEHGFVSYTSTEDGGVQAFWLDGRGMLDSGPMQLRTTRLGESNSASTVLDERVCECCDTDAATTSSGPLVAYRDRDAQEIRDIYVVRWTAEGWSAPGLVHADGWHIQGCPVNGPAVAAHEDRVAIAWFTAADSRARVQVAFSADGGAGFDPPVVVDDADPLGRVDLVLAPGGIAIVSWMGRMEDEAEIRWRRVGIDGTLGRINTVARTSAGRSAGVPRMVRRDDELIFAWMDRDLAAVRVAALDL